MDATASTTSLATFTLASAVSTHTRCSSRDFGSATPWRTSGRPALKSQQTWKQLKNKTGLARWMTHSIAPLHCHFVHPLLQNGQSDLSTTDSPFKVNPFLTYLFAKKFLSVSVKINFSGFTQQTVFWLFWHSLCPYLSKFWMHILQHKVDNKWAAFHRNWVCDVVLDKTAAGSPVRKKHKSLGREEK